MDIKHSNSNHEKRLRSILEDSCNDKLPPIVQQAGKRNTAHRNHIELHSGVHIESATLTYTVAFFNSLILQIQVKREQ